MASRWRSRWIFAYTVSPPWLHITIGEQVPKIWAIVSAEEMARRIAGPLHVFT